jgi:hypothetical protein
MSTNYHGRGSGTNASTGRNVNTVNSFWVYRIKDVAEIVAKQVLKYSATAAYLMAYYGITMNIYVHLITISQLSS